MLLSIVSRPSKECFVHGSQQAADFDELKTQCSLGWTTVSGRTRLWMVKYTIKKLALLLVLRDQVDSKKKVPHLSSRWHHHHAADDRPQASSLRQSLVSHSETNLFASHLSTAS